MMITTTLELQNTYRGSYKYAFKFPPDNRSTVLRTACNRRHKKPSEETNFYAEGQVKCFVCFVPPLHGNQPGDGVNCERTVTLRSLTYMSQINSHWNVFKVTKSSW